MRHSWNYSFVVVVMPDDLCKKGNSLAFLMLTFLFYAIVYAVFKGRVKPLSDFSAVSIQVRSGMPSS